MDDEKWKEKSFESIEVDRMYSNVVEEFHRVGKDFSIWPKQMLNNVHRLMHKTNLILLMLNQSNFH